MVHCLHDSQLDQTLWYHTTYTTQIKISASWSMNGNYVWRLLSRELLLFMVGWCIKTWECGKPIHVLLMGGRNKKLVGDDPKTAYDHKLDKCFHPCLVLHSIFLKLKRYLFFHSSTNIVHLFKYLWLSVPFQNLKVINISKFKFKFESVYCISCKVFTISNFTINQILSIRTYYTTNTKMINRVTIYIMLDMCT